MSLANQTIVVAEDTYDDRELVSEILSLSGCTVHLANNGADCITLVHTVQPALIITDLAMPEMNGWEVLTYLRNNAATAHIPVVALTAYYSVNVMQDAKNAGFDAFFAKPVSPMDFLSKIEALL